MRRCRQPRREAAPQYDLYAADLSEVSSKTYHQPMAFLHFIEVFQNLDT